MFTALALSIILTFCTVVSLGAGVILTYATGLSPASEPYATIWLSIITAVFWFLWHMMSKIERYYQNDFDQAHWTPDLIKTARILIVVGCLIAAGSAVWLAYFVRDVLAANCHTFSVFPI